MEHKELLNRTSCNTCNKDLSSSARHNRNGTATYGLIKGLCYNCYMKKKNNENYNKKVFLSNKGFLTFNELKNWIILNENNESPLFVNGRFNVNGEDLEDDEVLNVQELKD